MSLNLWSGRSCRSLWSGTCGVEEVYCIPLNCECVVQHNILMLLNLRVCPVTSNNLVWVDLRSVPYDIECAGVD